MSQTLISKMLSPLKNGKAGAPEWSEIKSFDMGSGCAMAISHNPEDLIIRVTGISSINTMELVFTPPERGKWSFFMQSDGTTDVQSTGVSRIIPRFKAVREGNTLLFTIKHTDLAPENVLACTPVDGEQWQMELRIFTDTRSYMPVVWLDEGTELAFSGGRSEKAVSLKKEKTAVTGAGLVLIRLAFGATVPKDALVFIEPKDKFIQVKSKDLSYVKGRIAKTGIYRLCVDMPRIQTEALLEEVEEDTGETEDKPEKEAKPDTRFIAGLSFLVPDVWERAEQMDKHVRQLSSQTDTTNPDVEKVLIEFEEMLTAVERYRTPQAKGVLKEEELSALEERFWKAAAVLRSSPAPNGTLHLVCPYLPDKPFIKGMLATAKDDTEATKAVKKAERLGLTFILLATEPGTNSPNSDSCLVIPGAVKYYYSKLLEFTAGSGKFNILVPPVPQVKWLPEHLSMARAVAGNMPYWHDALASGYRLSYIEIDRCEEGDNGTALVYVQADSNPENILNALNTGAYYTRISPAPEIERVECSGLTLTVKRSHHEGMAPMVFLGRSGASLMMSPDEQVKYSLAGQEQFARVQILAGTVQVAGAPVNILTVLNPVYWSDWVTPWLDEVYASKGAEEEEQVENS